MIKIRRSILKGIPAHSSVPEIVPKHSLYSKAHSDTPPNRDSYKPMYLICLIFYTAKAYLSSRFMKNKEKIKGEIFSA